MSAPARVPTIAARLALPLVLEWKRRGRDPKGLLLPFGRDEAALRSFEARIPLALFTELHSRCVAATGDTAFALAALDMLEQAAFPPALHLVSSQETLLEGIQYALPLVGSMVDELELEFVTFDRIVRARFRCAGEPLGPPAFAEYFLALLWRFARRVAPHAAAPTCVELPSRGAWHGEALRAFFEDCDVRCETGHVGFEGVIPAVAIPNADPALGEVLAATPVLWAAQSAAPMRVRDRAWSFLRANLAGDVPTAQRLASALRMSDRSLRRHLRDEGTSLRELVDAVRRERALALLEADHLNLQAIALELGYESANAFGRAFRGWTGETPTEFRSRRARGA